MGKSEYSIDEIKKLWQQEPRDDYVLKAATKDKNEYLPEIQAIIKEEAIRRGLLRKSNEQSISPDELRLNDQSKLTERRPGLKDKLTNFIVSGLSFVLFFILYKYFGLALSIPAIGFFLCLVVANKFLPPAKKPMLLAIALQAGFVLSFSLIAVLAGEFRGTAMWELLFTAGAVTWLIIRPSIGPVVLLTVLHTLTLLAMALVIFLQIDLESVSPTYKSFLLNLIFRVPAIIFMYTGLRGIRRTKKTTTDVITPTTGSSEK